MGYDVTEIQEILKKNIKEYRSRLGYTQAKLAELCGVATSYIGEIEIARKFPSAKMLQKLSAALKVKPYKLFLGENDIEDYDVSDILNYISKNLKGQIDQSVEELLIKLRA
jgi:transcriptional regulator with XRE-family HTH domain